jgi:hypothetical protein
MYAAAPGRHRRALIVVATNRYHFMCSNEICRDVAGRKGSCMLREWETEYDVGEQVLV